MSFSPGFKSAEVYYPAALNIHLIYEFSGNRKMAGKKERPPDERRPLVKEPLVLEERSAQSLVASAATAVLPLHLHQPVVAAKGLVEFRSVGSSLNGSELEVALVCIFLAAAIKPGTQIGIGNGF